MPAGKNSARYHDRVARRGGDKQHPLQLQHKYLWTFAVVVGVLMTEFVLQVVIWGTFPLEVGRHDLVRLRFPATVSPTVPNASVTLIRLTD